MKRLGEILLERGAIAIAELHTGLEACHHNGGRLGTQLLRFGFVDEHALLEALSEQLGVPSVSTATLRRAPDALRKIIPTDVARRLQVVVFVRKGSSLGVAMTNPRNPAVTEEIVSYVGLDMTPYVATEAGILAALTDLDGGHPNAAERPQPGFVDPGNEWRTLWAPPQLRPSALIRRHHHRSDDQPAIAASFPALVPVPDGGSFSDASSIDARVFNVLLRDAEHRDEIGALLLRRVSSLLERCYLLALHSGRLVGWLGRGPGVVVDDLQTLSAPADGPSILGKVDDRESYCGPIPAGPVDDLILEAFGDPPPAEVVILPLLVKNRVVAYLFGETPANGLSPELLRELQTALAKAGLAIEILIMKRKILA